MDNNRGYRNNQAVQVLNKLERDVTDNPIGLVEDFEAPDSCNFGTDRLPRRGGCYNLHRVVGSRIASTWIGSGDISYTISMWYECSSDTASQFALFGNASYYWCSRSNNNLNFRTDVPTNINIATFINVFSGPGFYHILLVKTPTTLTLFKNGVEFETKAYIGYKDAAQVTGLLGLTSNTLYVNDSRAFDFRIYNRAISFSEAFDVFAGKIIGDEYLIYKAGENYGPTAYDASGNGNNGTIVNAITVTPEENPNSIHQYQDLYSWHNESGGSKSGSVYVPRNEIVTLPPFKDVLGNDLQFIGKVPGRAKFVQSSCFKNINGSGGAYLTLANSIAAYNQQNIEIGLSGWLVLQNDTLFLINAGTNLGVKIEHVYGVGEPIKVTIGTGSSSVVYTFAFPAALFSESSAVANTMSFKITESLITVTVNGASTSKAKTETIAWGATNRMFGTAALYDSFVCSLWAVEYNQLDSSGNYIQTLGYWPLCEPIINPAAHTYHDIVNGNHATLVNGLAANDGKQDEYHYLQNGFNIDGNGNYVPKHLTNNTDCLGNVLTYAQDGKSLLNNGAKLRPYNYPALIQPEQSNRFWTDTANAVIDKSFTDFTGAETGDRVFADVADVYRLKNIRTHKSSLIPRQKNTEIKLTNNQP